MEKLSDEGIKLRVRTGVLSLLFALPLTLVASYYGWQETKVLFGFGRPELIHYSPVFLTLATSIWGLFPLFIANLWYVTTRRNLPERLHKSLTNIFTVTFLSWLLLIFPFMMWAPHSLESKDYTLCVKGYSPKGINAYVLDQALCPRR